MSEELAVFNQDKESKIQKYVRDTLYVTMQFDNVGDFFKSEIYNNGKTILSDVISDMVTNRYQENFHEKLNFMEKANYISSSKREKYEKNCNLIKSGSKLTVELIADTLPLLYQAVDNKRNQRNAKDFILNWMGYINQGNEISTIISTNAKAIINAMDLCYNENELKETLLNASTMSSGLLPKLNKKNLIAFNSVENGELLSLAKMIIASADLKEYKTKDRALEFISEMFYVGYSEAESKLKDIMDAQEHITQLLSLSSIDYMVFFSKFIASAEDTIRFGTYDINMDAYAQLRQRNQEKVKQIGMNVREIGVNAAKAFVLKDYKSLSGCITPTRDIMKISEEMMNDTIQPPQSMMWEFMDAIMERNETFELKGAE